MKGYIETRRKGVYVLRFDLGKDPETGKRRRPSEMFRGKKEDAEARLREILTQFETGRRVEPSSKTLWTYLEKWLEVAVRPSVSQRTAEDWAENLRRYVRATLGDIQLKRLTPMLIQEVYQRMLSGDLTGRALKPNTVRKLHVILHKALRQACKWRELAYAPTEDVEVPRGRRAQAARALNQEQLEAFVDKALSDRWAALWLVLVFGGCRPEEVLGLRWPRVLFDHSALQIEEVLVRSRKAAQDAPAWRLEPPKTARSRRTVPLPLPVMRALHHHRAAQEEEKRFFADYRDQDFVFATHTGEPLTHANLVNRYFKPLVKAAGLPPATRLYDLRHSHATQLLAQGENVKIVSARMGHSSTAFTMDTYVQLVENEQQAASDRMAERFFGKKAQLKACE